MSELAASSERAGRAGVRRRAGARRSAHRRLRRQRRPLRQSSGAGRWSTIAEEDLAKCTNCKTCYQDVSELFEKTTIVVDGETKEVGQRDSGRRSTRVKRHAGAEAPDHARRRQLRCGDHSMSTADRPTRVQRRPASATGRPPRALETHAEPSSRRSSRARRSSVFQKQLDAVAAAAAERSAVASATCSSPTACRRSSGSSSRRNSAPTFTTDALEPAAARRRHEHGAAALHLGRAAQVQAQVHPRDRRASVRPLPDVQGAVGGLAGPEQHSALHPSGRGARAATSTW